MILVKQFLFFKVEATLHCIRLKCDKNSDPAGLEPVSTRLVGSALTN